MFDQSSFSGAAGYDQSPSTQSVAASRRRAPDAGILPITCADLRRLLTNETSITVGSKQYSSISIGGKIVEVDRGVATHTDYIIQDSNDTTATAKIRQFSDVHANQEEYVEEQIILAYGTIREFQGEKFVTGLHIRAIRDEDLQMHLAEATYAKMYYEKNIPGKLSNIVHSGGKLKPVDIIKVAQGAGMAAGIDASMARPIQMAGAGAPQASGPHFNRNELTNKVFDMIDQATRNVSMDQNEGVAKEDIFAKLTGYPRQKIETEIQFLTDEGHIYTTIDDDHFSSAQNDVM